ncbi:hypothetical protein HK104_004842 [Borealophlyctis nickersoniae]|nr:hypothetical protein HK104_004842 [Borealophlyctis nickersoniae]
MDDSTLKALTITSKGTSNRLALQPPFARGVKEYSGVAGSDVAALIIQATPNESDAFVQVRKVASDGSLEIREGNNDIEIKVDAPDGSSSIYLVHVFRPSSADASLKGFEFSKGSLRPDFHKLETHYTLCVGKYDDTASIAALALNPKSKVQSSCSTKEITLLLGDTPVEFTVTSADGTASQVYRVIIRRDKRGSRPELSSSASVNPTLCFTCLDLIKLNRPTAAATTSQDGSAETNAQSAGVKCPLCPESAPPAWKNDPLMDPDPEAEAVLGKLQIMCPFGRYGCQEKPMDLAVLGPHVQTCAFVPSACKECEAPFVAKADMAEGKHKVACMMTCGECGRKLAVADKAFHDRNCPAKAGKPEPKTAALTAAPWESESVDRKNLPGTVEGCMAAVEAKMGQYSQSLRKSIQAAAESSGTSAIHPDLALLDDCAKLCATAISLNRETQSVKGGSLDETLHLQLGRVLEEAVRCRQLFPAPAARSTAKTNENEMAHESFQSDEVDGLLEQLGVSLAASDAVKLRAIEEEYHRLLALGLSDQASEAQELHAWKVKQVADATGTTAWNAGLAKSGGVSAALENVREKYHSAVTINSSNADANCHYGRILLECGEVTDAITHLRLAVGQKPTFKMARFYLGVALLHPLAPPLSVEVIAEAKAYLSESIGYFRDAQWIPSAETAMSGDIKTLTDSIYLVHHADLAAGCIALSRAYRLTSRAVEAANVLSDLLYLIPDGMSRVHPRSETYARMGRTLCDAQKELLLSLPRTRGELFQMQLASVKSNLLSVTQRMVGKTGYGGSPDANICNKSEEIAQVLVTTSPTSPVLLCALGQAQLNQYDFNPRFAGNLAKLKDAEGTFLASIAAEGDQMAPPSRITEQAWWTQLKDEMSKEIAPPTQEGKPTGSATGGKKAPVAAQKPTTTTSGKPAGAARTPAAAVKKPAAPATAISAPKATTKQVTPKAAGDVKSPALAPPPKAQPSSMTSRSKPTPTTKPGPAVGSSKVKASPGTAATKDAAVSPKKEAPPAALPSETPATQPAAPTLRLYESRLGLARTLSRRLPPNIKGDPEQSEPVLSEVIKYYREAIALSPYHHDSYIELGSIVEKHVGVSAAADLFLSFPFPNIDTQTGVPSQDDLYLHGEVTRLLMKEKRYDDPGLLASLIAEGRAGGIKGLSKYVDALDAAGKSKTLMALYAGVNRKHLDDPDLVSFFKAKFWL